MTPVRRPECPSFLKEHWREWGEEYAARRAENPAYIFRWKSWQGKAVNELLLGPLTRMTDEHCAYCDWFPTDCGTDRTIDHFKPKTDYPKEAYHWPNLYLACRQCQKKIVHSLTEAQLELLLRPDDPDYAFDRFFIYKHLTGEIEPNPAADSEEHRRAKMTIEAFRLNADGRPAARKRMLVQFSKLDQGSQSAFRQDQPFRFLLHAL
jgi:uncharacterized protein (TIGR02646 family)